MPSFCREWMVGMAIPIQACFPETGARCNDRHITSHSSISFMDHFEVCGFQSGKSISHGLKVIDEAYMFYLQLCADVCTVEVPIKISDLHLVIHDRACNTQANAVWFWMAAFCQKLLQYFDA